MISIKESNDELLTHLQELLKPLLKKNASRVATKEVPPRMPKSHEVSSSGLEDAPKPEKALEAKEVMPVILSEAPPPEPEAAPEDAGETAVFSAVSSGKMDLKPGRTPAWLWQQRGLNRLSISLSLSLSLSLYIYIYIHIYIYMYIYIYIYVYIHVCKDT